jgi:hypothetical protein
MKNRTLALLILITPILAGCSIINSTFNPPQGPTPIPVPSPTPLPGAEVHIFVSPPEGTSSDADLELVLLDEVTGLAFNTVTRPLDRLDDGLWYVRLTPPAGALIHYRYQRTKPELAREVSGDGRLIQERVIYIDGPMQVQDQVAAWSDEPSFDATGRIIGRVTNANSGEGLPEILVSVSGLTTFTEGDGSFRIDGLPPGEHKVTAWSTDGAYRTAQQGARIAAGSTTPAEFGMTPAKSVQVTFQVTVPADTFPGASIRIAGNIRQLGHIFSELSSSTRATTADMPTLIMIDPTHYLGVANVYAGTDLRYKYTLGDGLWNAERNPRGFFVTRQVIVPNHDLLLQDTVSTWHGDNYGSLEFHVTAPEWTPETDTIHIQFNPFTWFESLPMWRLDGSEWVFTLHSPLNFSGDFSYRYCRGVTCGSSDDIATSGTDAAGRPVSPGRDVQQIEDQIEAWKWYPQETPQVSVSSSGVSARPDFEAGLELLPSYHPAWKVSIQDSMGRIADIGGSAITLSPMWVLEETRWMPMINFDPALSPYRSALSAYARKAESQGLQVNLHPRLQPRRSTSGFWWQEAQRDRDWWEIWFEEYRSFVLTYADLAQEIGADKLILGEPILQPALPGGQLSDGSPSGVPQDAEGRWRSLIEEVRTLFSGDLAFELDLGEELQALPDFIDSFDEIHVYWHTPLASEKAPSLSDLRSNSAARLDETLLAQTEALGLPIVLSVEYPSVAGGVMACPPAPDGTCRDAQAFAVGAEVDPDLSVDLEGQAQAINAVLLEAVSRDAVTGFYVRGFNPAIAMLDKSASVHGKPAMTVLSTLYPIITGAAP